MRIDARFFLVCVLFRESEILIALTMVGFAQIHLKGESEKKEVIMFVIVRFQMKWAQKVIFRF